MEIKEVKPENLRIGELSCKHYISEKEYKLLKDSRSALDFIKKSLVEKISIGLINQSVIYSYKDYFYSEGKFGTELTSGCYNMVFEARFKPLSEALDRVQQLEDEVDLLKKQLESCKSLKLKKDS